MATTTTELESIRIVKLAFRALHMMPPFETIMELILKKKLKKG
jgi:hypothetical protein